MKRTIQDRSVRLVCKRCHTVMDDAEPMGLGEFNHPRDRGCRNDGKYFTLTRDDLPADPKETELFMRKRERRRLKRISK